MHHSCGFWVPGNWFLRSTVDPKVDSVIKNSWYNRHLVESRMPPILLVIKTFLVRPAVTEGCLWVSSWITGSFNSHDRPVSLLPPPPLNKGGKGGLVRWRDRQSHRATPQHSPNSIASLPDCRVSYGKICSSANCLWRDSDCSSATRPPLHSWHTYCFPVH